MPTTTAPDLVATGLHEDVGRWVAGRSPDGRLAERGAAAMEAAVTVGVSR